MDAFRLGLARCFLTVKHCGTLFRGACHCILSAKHNISSRVLDLALSRVEMKIPQHINCEKSVSKSPDAVQRQRV